MPQELIVFFQTAQSTDFIFPGIVVCIWLVYIFLILLFYFRLAFYRVSASGAASLPVTIIMVERNEEENLRNNLPGWLSAGYPEYEVLVVDDFSEDNSLTSVGVLRLRYPRLKLTGLNQETRYSQKLSRNLALKAASYDHAVFIHPCMEVPDDHWLPGIATALSGSKEIAVGYTRISPSKGYHHRLYRIESFFQQMESMAFCLNGMPFVANEENIAFRKHLYFDINGFAGKIGEEFLNMELIFNEVIRKKANSIMLAGNLALEKKIKAGKQEYNELLHKYYFLKRTLGFRIRLVSRIFNLLRLLFIPMLIACAVLYPFLWPELLFMLVVFLIIFLIIIKRLQNRLNESGIFITSVLYGLVAPYGRVFTHWRYNYQRKNR